MPVSVMTFAKPIHIEPVRLVIGFMVAVGLWFSTNLTRLAYQLTRLDSLPNNAPYTVPHRIFPPRPLRYNGLLFFILGSPVSHILGVFFRLSTSVRSKFRIDFRMLFSVALTRAIPATSLTVFPHAREIPASLIKRFQGFFNTADCTNFHNRTSEVPRPAFVEAAGESPWLKRNGVKSGFLSFYNSIINKLWESLKDSFKIVKALIKRGEK